jgi:hypothetical protein
MYEAFETGDVHPGDDAAFSRLFVAASRYGFEGWAGRLAATSFTEVFGRSILGSSSANFVLWRTYICLGQE